MTGQRRGALRHPVPGALFYCARRALTPLRGRPAGLTRKSPADIISEEKQPERRAVGRVHISVDLGTTAVKTGLYDSRGRRVKTFSREYPSQYSGRRVTQKAGDWILAVFEGIKAVAEGAPERIETICTGSQGITFVPVAADGEPLCGAITWLDMRAEKELSEFTEAAGGARELYSVTGKPQNASYSAPKLLWLRRNRPDIYEKTWKFLFPAGYVDLCLCGEAAADYSMASGSMLFDIRSRKWSGRLLEACGAEEKKMPEALAMGTRLAPVRAGLGRSLGIEGARVILGGQDQKLAALGADIGEGVCTVSLGTACAISSLSEPESGGEQVPVFAFDTERLIWETNISTCGAAVNWLCSALGFEGDCKKLDELAASAENSGGVRFCPEFETGASLSGLTLATTRAQLARALLEGVALRIKEKSRPFAPRRLSLFGGGAGSDVWCGIIEKTAGVPVTRVRDKQTALNGAYKLAKEAVL